MDNFIILDTDKINSLSLEAIGVYINLICDLKLNKKININSLNNFDDKVIAELLDNQIIKWDKEEDLWLTL